MASPAARLSQPHGELLAVGVEVCGPWGAGLARHLTARGVRVVAGKPAEPSEAPPARQSDTVDAEAAARAVLFDVALREVAFHGDARDPEVLIRPMSLAPALTEAERTVDGGVRVSFLDASSSYGVTDERCANLAKFDVLALI